LGFHDNAPWLGYIQKTRISGVSASTTINLTINNPVAVDLTSSLDALWDFSEGKGSTTADSSGNKNTGTLSSVAWNKARRSGCVSMNGYSGYISVAESSSLESLCNK